MLLTLPLYLLFLSPLDYRCYHLTLPPPLYSHHCHMGILKIKQLVIMKKIIVIRLIRNRCPSVSPCSLMTIRQEFKPCFKPPFFCFVSFLALQEVGEMDDQILQGFILEFMSEQEVWDKQRKKGDDETKTSHRAVIKMLLELLRVSPVRTDWHDGIEQRALWEGGSNGMGCGSISRLKKDILF